MLQSSMQLSVLTDVVQVCQDTTTGCGHQLFVYQFLIHMQLLRACLEVHGPCVYMRCQQRG